MTAQISSSMATTQIAQEQQEFEPRMRKAFGQLHRQATAKPFMVSLLETKRLSDRGYCQYLIDLHLIYQTMETQLLANQHLPYIEPLCMPEVFRAEAIKRDIDTFHHKGMKPLPHALEYKEHLEKIGRENPLLLISHAYTRYPGDLGGGRPISIAVNEIWPETKPTAFYNFDTWIKTLGNTEERPFMLYCNIINSLPLDASQQEQVIEETLSAFERANVMLDAMAEIPYWDLKTEVDETSIDKKLTEGLIHKDYPLMMCCVQHLNETIPSLCFALNDGDNFTIDITLRETQKKIAWIRMEEPLSPDLPLGTKIASIKPHTQLSDLDKAFILSTVLAVKDHSISHQLTFLANTVKEYFKDRD